jgi:hypothetical protein
MRDLLYLAGTVLFFALMRAYVRGCETLGRKPAEQRDDS